MSFTLTERRSGLLLHLSSLPGPYFVGGLGTEADLFAAGLARAGQSWWQMLPVNPIGDGNSPYATISSFAGEPLYIDLQGLARRGWLKHSEIAAPPGGAGRRVNYRAARQFKLARLRTALDRAMQDPALRRKLSAFRERERGWLRDYALFAALTARYATATWTNWPVPLRDRTPAALKAAERELAGELTYHELTQLIFADQWRAFKMRAHQLGVGLIGDLPIFVAHGSADVWAHRRYFRLDSAGRLTVQAGCPPDAFTPEGQCWGNALYDWQALAQDDFGWWTARLARATALFDAIRLDHFIGFRRYWEIDARARTAQGGHWRQAPGDAFFAAVTKKLGRPALIAEDLGAVTPAVRALRDKFGFPGMKVLQFAFDGTAEAAQHLPHRLPERAVVYTGTHDNNTTRGWYGDLERRARRDPVARSELGRVLAYLGTSSRTVHTDLMRAAMLSPASVTIFPVQDLLGLGTSARMNVPGVARGNWRYRLAPGEPHAAAWDSLLAMTQVSGRALGRPGQ